MKISEIITDKYKLRIPPTVYYELLADVVEVEEEQEPKTGHWVYTRNERKGDGFTEVYYPYCKCSECGMKQDTYSSQFINFCPNCGAKMVEPQESEK